MCGKHTIHKLCKLIISKFKIGVVRMVVNKEDEIILCYICKNPMVLKRGRYGMFWGCTNYPKCKGSIDARGTRIKLKELEILNLDYNKLFVSGEIHKIICECS